MLVQPIHLLRVFFGLALRLRLRGAFLLRGASLVVATSLLLYTVAEGVGKRQTWKATADSRTTSFNISQGHRPKVLLTLTTNVGPATPLPYSLTDKFTYRGRATNQAAAGFFATTVVAPTPLPTPLDAAKATVQRSWRTIKSAFR